MDKKETITLPDLDLRLLFGALAIASLIVNVFFLVRETYLQRHLKSRSFVGDRFAGLSAIIGKPRAVGYYTDKSLDITRQAMQFAQAQYILAPTILELNNLENEFIIFDCSSPRKAIEKIREIGAVPLKVNPYGTILARRPKL